MALLLIALIAAGVTVAINNNWWQRTGSTARPVAVQNERPDRKPERKTAAQAPPAKLLTGTPSGGTLSGGISATDRGAARLLSRSVSGREDPMNAISSFKPFPRGLASGDSSNPDTMDIPPPPNTGGMSDLLPPPPPSLAESDLPPPPPSFDAGGLASSDLPPPPEDQSLLRMLSLNAIIGNQAVLSLNDRTYRKTHGLKRFITLGPGESFDSVTLVALDRDQAIIEEDGQRSTLVLPSVR